MAPYNQHDVGPWYAQKKKQQQQMPRLKSLLTYLLPTFLVIFFANAFGYSLAMCLESSGISFFIFFIFCLLFLFLSLFCAVYQIGFICRSLSSQYEHESPLSLGLRFFRGELKNDDSRNGILAPEMALNQFVQQVRAYATEKSFLKQKQINVTDAGSILKRRWNDVHDSLNEFEVYLANDPTGVIEKLIARSAPQTMDVSQIFRDVAETFDTTWRSKGVNIEQAIVTPLCASTNELLLRRLLVGPWRTCVHFARRGGGVIFSAKSAKGKIVAQWHCAGVMLPEEFFSLIRNQEWSVNERIEKGLELIDADRSSPNTLFALISCVTWIDLVQAAGNQYSIRQGDEGFEINLHI